MKQSENFTSNAMEEIMETEASTTVSIRVIKKPKISFRIIMKPEVSIHVIKKTKVSIRIIQKPKISILVTKKPQALTNHVIKRARPRRRT